MSKVMEIPTEYKQLFEDWWREAALEGGRYSLKSHTVARFLLIRARQQKTRIGCFREFQNSIAESSHQLLKDLINEYNLHDFKVTDKTIENTINGSDFLFKGLHNNDQSIKSTEGIDIAWVEEAQTVSTNSIEVLTPTVRKPGSQIIYTYNRLEEEDPVHKRLVIEGRPNTLHIHTDYNVALKYGWMPEDLINEMEDDKKRRPDLYKHKWLGEPLELVESRIYTGWNKVDEVPKGARLERRWLDFGYSQDEAAIGEVWYYDGYWILNENLYRKGMSNKKLADFLNTLPQSEVTVVADSAEPKSIDEIASYGVNIVGVEKKIKGKPAGSKQTFRNWVIQLVQDQPIYYTVTSQNIAKEYKNYLWDVDKNGKILTHPDPTCSDHHMNGIEYALSTLGRLKQEEDHWSRLYYAEREQYPEEMTNPAV